MSGLVMGMILDKYPRTDHTSLVIALVLGDASNQDGTSVRPGVARIAKLARVSERTVQYHIQRFLAEGLLILVKFGGGRNRPSEYRFDLQWLGNQPSVLDTLKKGATTASIAIPCKNSAGASASITRQKVQEPRNQDCTQPLPIKPPPTPNTPDTSEVHTAGVDLEAELWNTKLPSSLENGRDALIAVALKYKRSPDELTAACMLALNVPNVRDPVAIAISKLKDKYWKAPPKKIVQPSAPKEKNIERLTSKDNAKKHLEQILALQKRRSF